MPEPRSRNRSIVIGAGVGGLVAAVGLAARGQEAIVYERAPAPGGKMREVQVGPSQLDAGPTVFTMRWVFEDIFAAAGASLADRVSMRPVEILARHAWESGAQLDLFADQTRSADAIAAFGGAAEGRRFLEFCAEARTIYETLEDPFIRAARPGNPLGLIARMGAGGIPGLMRIRPYSSLWSVLAKRFSDPRLRQLFGRYSTYCGSSPLLAPATLMLIAHVEQQGVWLIEGGMHRLAQALAELAESLGATIRYGAEVAEVLVERGRARGVRLATGERMLAETVVFNGDPAALPAGLLGPQLRRAVAGPGLANRSMSALTWNLVAQAEGFPLVRHSVFFSDDYTAEFDHIFGEGRVPTKPTVYVCAQDRDDRGNWPNGAPERLLCLVNAPPNGDRHTYSPTEVEQCAQRTFSFLERCGLRLHWEPQASLITTPADFADLFPGTGGALYGPASHGWKASFDRPGSRTKVPGLYLAGGGVHPGAGVPMAALSGRLAALSILEDLAST